MGRRGPLKLRVERVPSEEWGDLLDTILEQIMGGGSGDWCAEIHRVAASFENPPDPKGRERKRLVWEIRRLQERLASMD